MKKSTILAKKAQRKLLREKPKSEEEKEKELALEKIKLKKQQDQERRRLRRKKLQSIIDEESLAESEETSSSSSDEYQQTTVTAFAPEKEKRPSGSVAGGIANNTFLREIDQLRLRTEVGMKKAADAAGAWKDNPAIAARLKELSKDAKQRGILAMQSQTP